MIHIGNRIPLDIAIPGNTDGWRVSEITVLAKDANEWKGKLMLKTKGDIAQGHGWTAIRTKTGWDISGEGAILVGTGLRINAYHTYPFTLSGPVNNGVKQVLSRWLCENEKAGDKIQKPAVSVKAVLPNPVAELTPLVIQPAPVSEVIVSIHEGLLSPEERASLALASIDEDIRPVILLRKLRAALVCLNKLQRRLESFL